MIFNDIPKKYLDEAIRRINNEIKSYNYRLDWESSLHFKFAVQALARTLLELDWEEPVDAIVLTARSLVAEANKDSFELYAKDVLAGLADDDIEMRIAMEALTIGMNMTTDKKVEASINSHRKSEGR